MNKIELAPGAKLLSEQASSDLTEQLGHSDFFAAYSTKEIVKCSLGPGFIPCRIDVFDYVTNSLYHMYTNLPIKYLNNEGNELTDMLIRGVINKGIYQIAS